MMQDHHSTSDDSQCYPEMLRSFATWNCWGSKSGGIRFQTYLTLLRLADKLRDDKFKISLMNLKLEVGSASIHSVTRAVKWLHQTGMIHFVKGTSDYWDHEAGHRAPGSPAQFTILRYEHTTCQDGLFSKRGVRETLTFPPLPSEDAETVRGSGAYPLGHSGLSRGGLTSCEPLPKLDWHSDLMQGDYRLAQVLILMHQSQCNSLVLTPTTLARMLGIAISSAHENIVRWEDAGVTYQRRLALDECTETSRTIGKARWNHIHLQHARHENRRRESQRGNYLNRAMRNVQQDQRNEPKEPLGKALVFLTTNLVKSYTTRCRQERKQQATGIGWLTKDEMRMTDEQFDIAIGWGETPSMMPKLVVPPAFRWDEKAACWEFVAPSEDEMPEIPFHWMSQDELRRMRQSVQQ